MSSSQSDAVPRLKVWVYRASRRAETYLYVGAPDEFGGVPLELMQVLGRLELVMELELHPGRKLARADVERVMADVHERGWHLQMPPPTASPPGRQH
jgi:uncharacterized protein